MNPVEIYLRELVDIRSTGAAVPETSYYGPLAYYTYSNDRYEPCVFRSGEFIGTPEEAFDIGSSHLHLDPNPRQGDADD